MSTDLKIPEFSLPACTKADIEEMNCFNALVSSGPQVDIPTRSFLYAGCYARTCLVKAGTVLVGARIKVETIVSICGECVIRAGGENVKVSGYAVLKGEAGRKQAFHAIKDTWITMIYATELKDLEACEEEFTDEYEDLMTRR